MKNSVDNECGCKTAKEIKMLNKASKCAVSTGPISLAAAMMMGVSPGIALAASQSGETVDKTMVEDKIIVVGKKSEEALNLPTLHKPIIDTPKIVTTVSGELLEQRGMTSLEQALRNVADVTTAVGEGGTLNGDQFFIRGQSAKNDIFTDGLRDFGAFSRDSFNYESVQVLKGSSSTILGRGVTGGAINTVS